MQKWTRVLAGGVSGLLLLMMSAGWIVAQENTPTPPLPTPIPVELVCPLEELQAQQAELQALLTSFEADAQADPTQALDNLFRVGEAYQGLALACGYIPADAAERPVGEDIARILTALDTVYGDPLNGQVLYNSEIGCANCHEAGGGQVAPWTEGTFTRFEEVRSLDPALEGYAITQYLVESIVNPTGYVVPGYTPSMPAFYADQLTLQQVADLVAYLESQDGPSPE